MSDYFYNVYDENEGFYDSYDDYTYNDIANYENAGWKELYSNCIVPSSFQMSYYVLPFVVVNICLCFVNKVQARMFPSHLNITHVFSFILGTFLMHHSLENGHLYLLQLLISVYLLIKISFIDQMFVRFDFFISFFSVMYLLMCEILEKDPKKWHHVRGVLMIAVMKSISLAIDLKANRSLRENFSIISFLGYMCCPANCIFGPWTSFTEYLNGLTRARSRFKMNIKYFVQIVMNIMLAILCLLFSNCADVSLNIERPWKWMAAFISAFSFRMSHYFISFLSQATMISGGLAVNDIDSKISNVKHTQYLGYTVVKPWVIEFPRSLVNVVVAWNVPIHNFLKQYIFRALKPHGTFLAVFLTYVTSSLLHGLNFQLWATLLTIGAWSYVEFNVRSKLSQIFSACVLVNKCSVPCTKHHLGQNKALTVSINSIFFVLCLVNLAYLGAVFDSNYQLQTEGYKFKHTLETWHSLDYATHWLLILSYLFYCII